MCLRNVASLQASQAVGVAASSKIVWAKHSLESDGDRIEIGSRRRYENGCCDGNFGSIFMIYTFSDRPIIKLSVRVLFFISEMTTVTSLCR